jgi:hypothetical protein
MEFLDNSLEKKRKRKLKKMDNFNRFGVNLYLAGASEAMGQLRQLSPESVIAILAESAQAIGFVKADADSFALRFNEYLLADSRYMQMFQAGRNAMNTYYSDQSVAPRFFNLAFEEWNKPKQKEERQGTVSVLFTDIAGSTAMTQELGDAGAQEVVRAHNRIVLKPLENLKAMKSNILATASWPASIMPPNRWTLPHRCRSTPWPIPKPPRTCRCISRSALMPVSPSQKTTTSSAPRFNCQLELPIRLKGIKYLFLIRSTVFVRAKRCSSSRLKNSI